MNVARLALFVLYLGVGSCCAPGCSDVAPATPASRHRRAPQRSFTLTRYGRLFEDDTDAAVDRLDDLRGGKLCVPDASRALRVDDDRAEDDGI